MKTDTYRRPLWITAQSQLYGYVIDIPTTFHAAPTEVIYTCPPGSEVEVISTCGRVTRIVCYGKKMTEMLLHILLAEHLSLNANLFRIRLRSGFGSYRANNTPCGTPAYRSSYSSCSSKFSHPTTIHCNLLPISVILKSAF